MSRHLQLARRATETNAEPRPLDEDETALRSSKIREFPRRARSEDRLETASEPAPSYEMAVRILCPFCGSADSTAATPCCQQAVEFAQGGVAAETADADGFMAALAAAHHPSVIVLDSAASVSARGSWRLRDAAKPLVALLASALVGAVVSVATQRRLAQTAEAGPAVRPPVAASAKIPALAELAPSSPAPAAAQVEPAPATIASQPGPSASASLPAGGVANLAPAPAAPPAALVAAKPAEAPRGGEPLAHGAAGVPAPLRLVSVPPAPDPSKWRSLRRGMSRAAVRALLGYPKWTDHSRNIDFWLYEEDSIFGKGWVAFYDVDGPVSTWREP